jgi:Ca-activated chloride channel homolog
MTALFERAGLGELVLDRPWVLVLLPLPFLIRWVLPVWRDQRRMLRLPALAQLTNMGDRRIASAARPSVLTLAVALAAWALLVLASANPVRIEPPVTKQISGRDLMLAVDLSGSMETPDFVAADGSRVTRVQAAQSVLVDFIGRRQADRIGLIVFGSAAFVLAPFTNDHDSVLALLRDIAPRMAGPQTMIGDAIGLAAQQFEKAGARGRLLVLLTDGNDTGSRVPPRRAAEIAGGMGVRIYTVSMGDPSAVGETALDIPALEAIAKTTGGQHFHAVDRNSLEQIYHQIDAVEPEVFDSVSSRPRVQLFQWPLGAFALLVLALYGPIPALRHRLVRT